MVQMPVAGEAIRASVLAWLERFSACVQAVDYASARPFWHEGIVIFGTYQELVRSREKWEATQWDNVWPRTEGFAFDLGAVEVLASADGGMAVAVAPWTSVGFGQDGVAFDRPGRATVVLMKGGPEGWVGVHSHMSLGKGVPQDSYGQRPVMAR